MNKRKKVTFQDTISTRTNFLYKSTLHFFATANKKFNLKLVSEKTKKVAI